MILTLGMAALPSLRPVASLLAVLSVLFGADGEQLDEDAVLRLVEQARAGDRAARQRLYRQHVQRVFRTVRGMLRSDAEAEDATQDAMFAALTSLDRYSPRSGVRFAAWLTTIAVNTTRRRFRRRRLELTPTGELPDVVATDDDVGDDIDLAKQRAALLQALAELEPREREIVSLRYGSELNAAEIAKQLKLEPANVRKILERARVRLAERIEALVKSRGEPA
ncbi:MAG TPA: sigma-70 family RNA polymerase sigma factor [Gammaproteobacteria bacterium]|nr:sigma-70 family RNA polymerase sigma factor [Gammaproteobacteria bacterium]